MGKKIGRNEPCWCGSGKKFKYCHQNRDKEKPIQQQEVREALKKAFNKKCCLHPQANSNVCRGGIVRAHTIQRSGGLKRIAKEGHVYRCLVESNLHKPLEGFQPKLVGIRNASTFTGFCARHDDEAFAPIEKHSFENSIGQVFLLTYRAICHELFVKNAHYELEGVRRKLDRGWSPEEQLIYQQYINDETTGVLKTLQELDQIKTTCDVILTSGDYSQVRYYIVSFYEAPEILCSAVHQPEYNFKGEILQRLGDMSRPANWIHFTLTATDKGGAAVFSWLGDNEVCLSFIRSLHSLSDEDIPHAVVRYVFEFFENTYLAPLWWDKLDPSIQKKLVKRQLTEASLFSEHERTETCLLDDGIRAVAWKVTSRDTNVDL
jgi:hypothetical protein